MYEGCAYLDELFNCPIEMIRADGLLIFFNKLYQFALSRGEIFTFIVDQVPVSHYG